MNQQDPSKEILRPELITKIGYSIVRNQAEITKKSKFSDVTTPAMKSRYSDPKTDTNTDDVKQVLSEIQDVLFLDNAYAGFHDQDYLSLLEKYDDFVIGKIFSKVYDPANLWIGYRFIPTWLKIPFQAITLAVVVDTTHHDSFIAYVRKWHETFVREIPFLIPARGENSVWFDVAPMMRTKVTKACAKAGILIRSCTSFSSLGETFVHRLSGNVWENKQIFVEGECS
jgi:histidinol-phosphate aminotransferase